MPRQHRRHILTHRLHHHIGTHHRQHIRHQNSIPTRTIDTDSAHEIDLRTRRDHRIDLTELDPEPTHLHLKITTPHILERTDTIPPHKITRAIHPHTDTERRRNEPLRRQPHPIVIPTSQTDTRKIQLTHHTHRNRTQP